MSCEMDEFGYSFIEVCSFWRAHAMWLRRFNKIKCLTEYFYPFSLFLSLSLSSLFARLMTSVSWILLSKPKQYVTIAEFEFGLKILIEPIGIESLYSTSFRKKQGNFTRRTRVSRQHYSLHPNRIQQQWFVVIDAIITIFKSKLEVWYISRT